MIEHKSELYQGNKVTGFCGSSFILQRHFVISQIVFSGLYKKRMLFCYIGRQKFVVIPMITFTSDFNSFPLTVFLYLCLWSSAMSVLFLPPLSKLACGLFFYSPFIYCWVLYLNNVFIA